MKFLSKYKEHLIVMRPAINQIVNGVFNRVSGKYIEFKNGEYETDDKEEIAFLKAKPYFGSEIWEEKTGEQIKQEAVETIANLTGITDTKSGQVSFKCEKCGFEAKSKLGLTAHMKKHE